MAIVRYGKASDRMQSVTVITLSFNEVMTGLGDSEGAVEAWR
jgi:hypothetical protein